MYLKTIYDGTIARPPLMSAKPPIKFEEIGINTSNCYHTNFAEAALGCLNPKKMYITVHKRILVDSYTDVDDRTADINTPTDCLIKDFCKIGDDNMCHAYNQVKKGFATDFTIPEFVLLMTSYAGAYEDGNFSMDNLHSAMKAIASDNLYNMTTEQKIVETCDVNKVAGILGQVDFTSECKHHISKEINVAHEQDMATLIALGYVSTALLSHGVMK